jgi:hypothetical protein
MNINTNDPIGWVFGLIILFALGIGYLWMLGLMGAWTNAAGKLCSYLDMKTEAVRVSLLTPEERQAEIDAKKAEQLRKANSFWERIRRRLEQTETGY